MTDQPDSFHPLTDEVLWSWVDRGAPELDDHLRQHPEDADRVQSFRQQIDGVSRIGGAHTRLPEWIGPYRVTGFLGAGAMGVVYAARQQRPDREVAIKVLRAWGLGDPRQLVRFEREAAALGRLRHPAIATIYEAGATADGIPFLVMERIDGSGLLEHASRHRLDQRQRLELFGAVCDGVQAAHDGDVVHRDLKPGNILVDGEGRPRVVDFGLAQLADGDGGSFAATHTASGMAGTLPYMSPEQLDHTRGPVDERSDVYALGVILYELLVGRLPHALAGLPLTAVVRRVCDEVPERPRQVDPKLAAALEAVVLKGMSADRAHRYCSAAALAADVRRYLRDEPVTARAPGLAVRIRAWGRRRRTPLWAAASLLLAGVAVMGWLRTQPTEPVAQTLAQFAGGPLAELAPFDTMRWRREAIDIEHDGRWWEVAMIGGRTPRSIVAAAKARNAEKFREVVRRDLVGILAAIAPEVPAERVPVHLVPLGWRGEPVRLECTLTRDHWLRLQELGDVVMDLPEPELFGRPSDRVAAFQGVRYVGDGVEVLVDGAWHGLVSVAGIAVGELRRQTIERGVVDRDGDWNKRFAEDLPWLLRGLHVEVQDVVLVGLRDLQTNMDLPVRHVTLTTEKRRLLKNMEEGNR